MEEAKNSLSKNISIAYRLGQIYFDQNLAQYKIGCGQQFFLLRIFLEPGISVQELARDGHFDNATATRAVKKLEALGYVKTDADKKDHRVRRAYVTESATAVVEDTIRIRDAWCEQLMRGLGEDDRKQVQQLMERIAQNACGIV